MSKAVTTDYEFNLQPCYSDSMSTHTRPTAREHIAQIAAAHGWDIVPAFGIDPATPSRPGTVTDLIARGNQAALVTWNAEGTAALDIKAAQDGAPITAITKAARALGLIALRKVLEAEVAA